jgi:AraC-like DNA-binding protein
MQRSIHARPGLGAALQIVQEGGLPLRRVLVDFPSLIFVHSGRKTIRSADATFTANQGETLAVAAGSEIEVTNALPATGPYEAFCLSFDPQLCSATENPLSPARIISPAAALGRPPGYLLSAFQRAAASCERPADAPDGIIRHQLQEVLLALELLGWRFDARGATRTSARLRRLLGAGPDQRWKIGAAGKLLGMSEATLRRRLEAEGLGFREIIGQVRMGRALTLLQSSDLSVTQIAYEVGYESISQFTAKFRRHFGQSPGQLREHGAKH